MAELSNEAKLILLLGIANGGSVREDDLFGQAVKWEEINGPPDAENLARFAASIPQHKWELARAVAEASRE